MASSGVWENVILSKTPTFDGVCGMLSYNIFGYFCQSIFDLLLTDGKSTNVFFVTDVIVILFVTTDVFWRCYCHVVRWLMITANCDRCYSHIMF